MVNLNGMNILSSVKADAQERTKSASQRSPDGKDSSFKDIFGVSQEKLNGSTQQIFKKSDRTETNRRDDSKEKDLRATNDRADAKSNKVDRAERPERQDRTDRAERQDRAEAKSIPGAPSAPRGEIDRGPKMEPRAPQPINMKQPRLVKADAASETESDSLSQRVAWNEFLRKMNDELGISADKVLEAFQSLDENALAAPPEENVDQLVLALGLNSQQADMARKMFMDLLEKTKSKSLGAEIGSAAGAINLSLMSQRELQRKQLQTSLDKMNSKFFMTNGSQKPGDLQALKAALAQQSNPGQAPQAAGAALAGSSSALSEQVSLEAAAEGLGSDLNPKIGSLGADATKTMNELVAAMQPVTGAEQNQVIDTAASASNSESAAKAFAQALSAKLTADQKFADGDETSEESSDLMSSTAPANFSLATGKADGAFQTTLAQGPQASQGPQPMAVQDVINQASVMVRDGGGEMKVSLTPDGLGEVSMKVSVDNGRVNVQMVTESDEAKRLIEKGLAELKTNLNANNLSVDQIKVDTATNLGRQLEQQHNEQQRQSAQQFLENFRQNQQGWRRDFFPMPSASVARSQSTGSSSQPTPYYGGANKRANSSRRLDLVA